MLVVDGSRTMGRRHGIRARTGSHAVPVIELRGDIDLADARRLRRLLEAAGTPLVVDLSRCTLIDAGALALLLAARAARGPESVALVLAPGSVPERMLAVTGADALFPRAEGRRAACALVRGAVAAALR